MFHNLHRKPAPLAVTPTPGQIRALAGLLDAVDDVRDAADHRVHHNRVAFLAGRLHDARRACVRARWDPSMLDSLIVQTFAADLPDSIPTPYDSAAAVRALRDEGTGL